MADLCHASVSFSVLEFIMGPFGTMKRGLEMKECSDKAFMRPVAQSEVVVFFSLNAKHWN